jgi:hypothetical protein
MNTRHEAQQVNPIVRKAADQVADAKRRRTSKPKPKDLPRWECPDQLSLFDTSKATDRSKGQVS